MGDVKLQPGRWFRAKRSWIVGVGDYHAKHLSVAMPRGRRRGVDRPPPMPPHMRDDSGVIWGTLTADQRRQAVEQEREWEKRFDAWLRRTETKKAPAPPHRGSVIVHDMGRPDPYEVAARARSALAMLRQLAIEAGGLHTDRLVWVVQEYANTTRPGRTSLHELRRDEGALGEARRRLKHANEELAAARAAGGRAALARAESDRADARIAYARLRQRLESASAKRGHGLASFCLTAAEKHPVQRLATVFVGEYGPLILDFGAWCADTEYGAFVRHHPAASLAPFAWLNLLGHERFLWPPGWRKWATGSHEHCRGIWPARTVPPPVAFYVWAAYMLQALLEHPELSGCQLFLANRLASLRLIGASWHFVFRESTRPRRDRLLPVQLNGELLDHLAVSAAYRRSTRIKVPRETPCGYCGEPFRADDGRRRLCDNCSSAKTRNLIAQRRFRERNRRA